VYYTAGSTHHPFSVRHLQHLLCVLVQRMGLDLLSWSVSNKARQ
jgi:hypothetical protein